MRSFILIMFLFFLVYVPLYQIASNQLRKLLSPRFVVCVILVTLAGIYAPDIQMYLGAIFVIFLATTQGRVDAACRYIMLAAIVPQVLWRIGASGHYLGVMDSAGALGLSAYVVGKFETARRSSSAARRWTAEDFLVLVTYLIMAIGTAGFVKFEDTLRTFIGETLLVAVPYILFRSTLKNLADYRAAIACFGVAALFMAVFAVYESRFGADVFDIITKHITGNYVRNLDMRGGMVRASATMNGPLELACFETVGLFALASSRSFFRNAIGYYGSLGVIALGLFAAQSRGSLVALFASAVVLALALRKWAVGAAAAAVAVSAWPVLQILAGASPAVASFINGGADMHQGPHTDYRSLLLQRGLQEAAKHPFVGLPLPQVINSLADITQGEGIVDLVNVYLEILLISGIVGLLPFVVLTVTSGARGAGGFGRVTDPALLRARAFTLAAFTTVLIQLGFVSFIDRIPMLFVMNLFGIRLLVLERKTMSKAAGSSGAGVPSVPIEDEPLGGHIPGREAAWVPRLPAIS